MKGFTCLSNSCRNLRLLLILTVCGQWALRCTCSSRVPKNIFFYTVLSKPPINISFQHSKKLQHKNNIHRLSNAFRCSMSVSEQLFKNTSTCIYCSWKWQIDQSPSFVFCYLTVEKSLLFVMLDNNYCILLTIDGTF